MEAAQSQPGCAASPATSDAQPSAAWTPGPWSREVGAGRGAWIAGANMHGWAALACGNTDAEAEANARLIAAAPELYEALQFARDELRGQFGAEYDDIDAALAKARGEQ